MGAGLAKCCTGFFDRDGDGKVTADEVLVNFEKFVELLQSFLQASAMYMSVLEQQGIAVGNTPEILESIVHIAQASKISTRLAVQLTTLNELGKYGDLNGDGVVDEKDPVKFLEEAQNICDALINANVQVATLTAHKEALEAMIQIINMPKPSGQLVSSI